jgi:hypothetical protein
MKNMRNVGVFGCGLLLGIFLAVGWGAHGEQNTASTVSRLQVFGLVSGAFAVYDPTTGQIYMYDTHLDNCIAIRKIGVPGQPMIRVMN